MFIITFLGKRGDSEKKAEKYRINMVKFALKAVVRKL